MLVEESPQLLEEVLLQPKHCHVLNVVHTHVHQLRGGHNTLKHMLRGAGSISTFLALLILPLLLWLVLDTI